MVALIQDERVRQQVEGLFDELTLPDLRTAFFTSVEDFESLYLREPAASSESTETELRLFSEVHLFIYALDSIGHRTSSQWIEHLRGRLKPRGYWPAAGMRLVALKYEDDNVPKLDLLNPALDDLIYLPLDRLTFLQKMQILLSLPKRATPTYLFNQAMSQTIEISKITKVDRLSDVAFAIRNPVPLKRGLPGHFYLTLPGERTALALKAKAFKSEPHPDHPGQFLVYFTFFGLPKATVSQIRRALQTDSHYRSLIVDDPARFAFRADDLFLSDEEKHQFGVVIIDRDQHEAQQLADHLRNDMGRLLVQTEASYSLFLHRYLDRDSAPQTPPRPSARDELGPPGQEFVIQVKDQKLGGLKPMPKDDAKILGFAAGDLLTDPTLWPRLIADRATRLLIEDAGHLTGAGKPLEQIVTLHDALDARVAVHATLARGPDEHSVALTLKPVSADELHAHANARRRHDHLEALIVEAAIVPADPSAWVEGLRTRARELGLTPPGHELKFWVINDRDDVPDAWLNTPELCGAMRRPVDPRKMLFSLSENLPNGNTVYNFGNLGWSQPGLNVHVAKPIALEALSEYGATLRAEHPLAPGSMLYLRKSIFDDAPNQCLAARVYACEEHPTTEGEYQVFVLYWGINDAFLKFARTWIRDFYASQKQDS